MSCFAAFLPAGNLRVSPFEAYRHMQRASCSSAASRRLYFSAGRLGPRCGGVVVGGVRLVRLRLYLHVCAGVGGEIESDRRAASYSVTMNAPFQTINVAFCTSVFGHLYYAF
jgi:hypothetical protein